MQENHTEPGSHELFVSLLMRHEPSLRAYIRAGVQSSHDVAEVMQEVSLVAWRKFSDLEDPESDFAKWACVIARYEIMKFRRGKARDRLVLSDTVVEKITEEGLEEGEHRESRLSKLEGCLAKLPKDRRQLVVQAYTPDFSIKEFAQSIGKSPDALYQLLKRIRAELADCVERRTEPA